VTVGRSLQETRDGLTFKEPKNGRTRSVGIDAEVARELKARRKAQSERRLSLGVAYQDQGLIFPDVGGAPMSPHVLTRKFDRFRDRETTAALALMDKLKKEGKAASKECVAAAALAAVLPTFRWHDWRHSYASQQLRAGEQVLVVSKALGHATTAFTMDVYGHVLPGEQTAAAARHGERIAAARARRQAAGAGK
jgi:integrase